jgi:hypothetical protein
MILQALFGGRSWGKPKTSVRLEAAEESLIAAGASSRAAALLVAAGYTSPGSVRDAPWTAEEAGRQYESAEWRLSMQPGATAAVLADIQRFRERLLQSSATPPDAA